MRHIAIAVVLLIMAALVFPGCGNSTEDTPAEALTESKTGPAKQTARIMAAPLVTTGPAKQTARIKAGPPIAKGEPVGNYSSSSRLGQIDRMAQQLRASGALLQNKFKGSGKALSDKYMKDFPDDEYTPHVLFVCGLIDYWHRPEMAISQFEVVLEKYPDHMRAPRARLYLCTLYEMVGNWEKAASVWGHVVKKHAESEDIDEFKVRQRIANRKLEFMKTGKRPSLAELSK
ncbi:hypothetical protein ACFL1X_12950 [Candidatus Hydrogenedentota bacterium]